VTSILIVGFTDPENVSAIASSSQCQRSWDHNALRCFILTHEFMEERVHEIFEAIIVGSHASPLLLWLVEGCLSVILGGFRLKLLGNRFDFMEDAEQVAARICGSLQRSSRP